MRRKSRWITAIMIGLCLWAASCLILTGCGSQSGSDPAENTEEQSADANEESASRDFYAMDTYVTVTAYGPAAEGAVEQAEAEVHRLDAMFSTGDPDSEISRLNQSGEAVLSEEAAGLVKTGLDMYERTDETFDIAIYPIMEAWGFADKKYRVPSEGERQALLSLTDVDKIDLDDETHRVSFGEKGMGIDLGGIAKGYTSDKIIGLMRDCGVTSGIVNLGGNVQVLGSRPDGSDWRIAVQDPRGDGHYLGVLEASDIAVITSGPYERNFTQNGNLYHHIIDPATGYPAEQELQSVTTVTGDATLADALSTGLYVMGKEKAISYWKKHTEDFDFILLSDEGEVYITPPLEKSFTSEDYPVHVIE